MTDLEARLLTIAAAERLGLDRRRSTLDREAHRQGLKVQTLRTEAVAPPDYYPNKPPRGRDRQIPEPPQACGQRTATAEHIPLANRPLGSGTIESHLPPAPMPFQARRPTVDPRRGRGAPVFGNPLAQWPLASPLPPPGQTRRRQ
jgi:hypothetical protein